MKNAVLALGLLCSPAFASVDFPSLNFPSDSQWAIGMIERACKVNLNARVLTGVIEADGPGVVYAAYDRNGDLVAAAEATSTSILAKKACLGVRR